MSRSALDRRLLLQAYCQGIFPMAVDKQGTIGWFSPDPRALIPLDDRFHISHSLKRTLRQGRFQITFDQQFETVIRTCAKAHGSTWISDEIIRSYVDLHHSGQAHSVETWHEGKLVGGLYGVRIGAAFFGESMFHRETDASKVALVELVERLRSGRFQLLDTQWTTSHLAQFGTYLIPRPEYLAILARATVVPCEF
ncbi:MAG TPA: leucyl/phenylalanyl-tRNA--protein transferase [Verrucomicrobiae bacterium]|nr:leucyl/phenylalanyl-tRNA--protein transferase [Verrucomicrobiae bacterium]